MEWKDAMDGKGFAFVLVVDAVPHFDLMIHQYTGLSDNWFLSSRFLNVDTESLWTTDVEVAKQKAFQIATSKLGQQKEVISKLVTQFA